MLLWATVLEYLAKMPAHLTHALFADLLLDKIAPDAPRSGVVAGAQFPDLFLHNHRTEPSGLKYGLLLHRSGYGRVLSGALEGADRSEELLRGFWFGAATHAYLDRRMHPFINYFAGWVEAGRLETADRRYAHAFYERIIDRLLLRRYRGRDSFETSFAEGFYLGEDLPNGLVEPIVAGLSSAYIGARDDHELPDRVRSAYTDSLRYYRWVDRPLKDLSATRPELDTRRLMSLVHPTWLPGGIDYANESHGRWCNPTDPTDERWDDLYTVFAEAVRSGVDDLFPLWQAYDGGDRESIESIVGNGDLREGADTPRKLVVHGALPLHRAMDALGAELARRQRKAPDTDE